MNPRASVHPSAAAPRGRRWPWVAGAALLLLILLAIRPPFVVRPIPGRAGASGPGENAATPAEAAGESILNTVWPKVSPKIEAEAQDIARLLPELRADPEAAGQKYGRREGTNAWNYMVKGTGKVTEVRTQSQAGTALVEIPGVSEPVALQIGPVVRGTALRDATGLVSFNQFTNQIDFAEIGKEMNGRALQAAWTGGEAASFPYAGKTVAFFGALTFDPRAKGPVLIVPLKIAETPAANP